MRHRVFTYITRGQQLLLLRYPDGRYLLSQIPGGTVKKGETPSKAALREAKEETGLEAIRLVRCLGSFKRDLSGIGRNETIMAWFFHLQTNEQTPNSWRHFETEPSEGGDAIEFELFWVPLSAIPSLGGIDECLLEELHASAQSLTSV